MKAITILEPWASLIACGKKKIETRGWATKYRGKIAIHAGISEKYENSLPIFEEPFISGLKQYCFYRNDGSLSGMSLAHGKVIAIADLVDCVKINESHIHYLVLDLENGRSNEYAFGDFTIGRYAWILDNVQAIKPVEAKGQQGLWNWVEKTI